MVCFIVRFLLQRTVRLLLVRRLLLNGLNCVKMWRLLLLLLLLWRWQLLLMVSLLQLVRKTASIGTRSLFVEHLFLSSTLQFLLFYL